MMKAKKIKFIPLILGMGALCTTSFSSCGYIKRAIKGELVSEEQAVALFEKYRAILDEKGKSLGLELEMHDVEYERLDTEINRIENLKSLTAETTGEGYKLSISVEYSYFFKNININCDFDFGHLYNNSKDPKGEMTVEKLKLPVTLVNGIADKQMDEAIVEEMWGEVPADPQDWVSHGDVFYYDEKYPFTVDLTHSISISMSPDGYQRDLYIYSIGNLEV